MSLPRLRLLGPLQLQCSGAAPLPLPWQRPAALLALLACADDWLPREHLATRLRPDADPETSRAYLRRLLHRLREVVPGVHGALQVEPARLRWAGASDVREFRAALAAQQWDQALALHAAPLLDGAAPLGDAALDDWLDDERLLLRRRWRAALAAALELCAAAGDATRTLALMQRLLDDDPLDEEGVQWALARAAAPGADEAQRRLALQAHAELSRRLALDMALKPLPATEALAQRLREVRAAALTAMAEPAVNGTAAAGSAAAAPAAESAAAGASGPALPASSAGAGDFSRTAPLVGREADLARVADLLAQPGVRWITLRGPGGIGKTRLAQEVVARARSGQLALPTALWVSLAAVESEAGLHDALAVALGLQGGGGRTADQLHAALAERQTLLVLDNVEQLQPQAGALQALARAAPGVCWLATSRETLGLAGEHLLDIGGLATTGPGAPALALLAEHAQRHGCAPDLADPLQAAAARSLVDSLQGLPLAIELAAAWLPVMTLPEVAERVATDLDFLASDAVARAPAHRSLRAVFDASWRRLDGVQQQALAALSVIHGSFDAAAAHDVARCDARTLLQLAGKSLLQREAAGRFRLHPLLRQFAAEAADRETREAVRRRHAQHFLGRLAAPPALRPGDGDPRQVAALLPWLPDLGAAWCHAAETRDLALLERAQPNLDGLLALSGRLEEAEHLAALAADTLPSEHPLRWQVEAWRVASLVTLDRSREGEALADRLLARGAALPAAPRCTAAAAKTRLAHDRGDTAAALHWAQAALAAAEEAQLPVARMRCLQNLGAVRWVAGDQVGSEAAWHAMLALAEAHGSALQTARALRGLGVMAQMQGRLQQGLALLQRAAAQFDALGDRVELSQAQRSISFVLRDLGRHAEQLHWAQQGVSRGEDLGLPHLQVPNLFALALACEDNAQPEAARSTYLRCLALARRQQMVPLQLRCLFGLGGLCARGATGQAPGRAAAAESLQRRELALTSLVFALAHPSLRPADRDEARLRLAAAAPTPAEHHAAEAAAAAATLDALCLQWLASGY